MANDWARIKELFAACHELSSAERAPFLDGACKGDAELRGHVESLIASYHEAGDFLERPAAMGTAVHVAPGLRLGPYEVLERIAAGGMGEVYRARDVRLGRIVALKILPPSAADHPEARLRFEREARLISSLNHPNICALFDVGRHESLDFLVMEFLDGETLARRLERGPLPAAELQRYAIQIADALDCAHRQGVVHRDLKPSNIILTEAGAKLLDFGIATLHDADDDGVIDSTQRSLVALTGHSRIAGTVAYMSPEQVRGEPIDARSDLFSFGAVMYEMAAGSRPFAGENTAEVRSAIATTPAPPVSSVNPEVGFGLSALITKALEPDLARRYQRAAEIRRDLLQLTRVSRVTPWVAAAVGAAALVAVGGLFLSLTNVPPASEVRSVRSVAVLPFKPLVAGGVDDDYIGVALADALVTELKAINAVVVRPVSATSRSAQSGLDAVGVGREVDADVVVEGAIQRSGDLLRVSVQLLRVADGVAIWSDRFDARWVDVFGVQDAIAEQVARALEVTLTGDDRRRVLRRRTADIGAYEAYLKGRYFWNTRTADGLQRARGYFQEAIERDSSYAPAHAGLADTYALLGSLAVAAIPPREAGPKAIEAAARALDLDSTLAEAHVSMAFATYSFNWDWQGAERHFRRAIELDPDYGTAHHWYALYLGQLGRLDEALAAAQRALRLEPLSLVGTYAVGLAHYQARRFDLARDYAGRLLEIAPDFPHGTRLMGSVDIAEGRYAPAIIAHERLCAAHPRSSLYAAWLAHAYGRAGQQVRAQQILDELVAASKTAYVSAANIAIGYIGLGDTDAALSWLEKGYAERSQALTFLKTDPVYDPLRSDPRFVDLMRRVGLAP
ncbi:MAG TPA: protein kinase [Vicinamibacterales bacterium]|nr:protein kinase [Vicinamibacterales bacterium]